MKTKLTTTKYITEPQHLGSQTVDSAGLEDTNQHQVWRIGFITLLQIALLRSSQQQQSPGNWFYSDSHRLQSTQHNFVTILMSRSTNHSALSSSIAQETGPTHTHSQVVTGHSQIVCYHLLHRSSNTAQHPHITPTSLTLRFVIKTVSMLIKLS